MDMLTVCPLPKIFTLDLSASRASLISWKVFDLVPLRNMETANSAKVDFPSSVFSLPMRKVMLTLTEFPRVDLLRKAYLAPPGNSPVFVLAKMLAGEGSNSSACARACFPL